MTERVGGEIISSSGIIIGFGRGVLVLSVKKAILNSAFKEVSA